MRFIDKAPVSGSRVTASLLTYNETGERGQRWTVETQITLNGKTLRVPAAP